MDIELIPEKEVTAITSLYSGFSKKQLTMMLLLKTARKRKSSTAKKHISVLETMLKSSK